MQHAHFAKKLLAWHETVDRPMPWKGERNPYFIWLSEIILQQTRVEQGLPYYLRFKKRFPNVKALAEASEDEVLKLWQGLGYNTRARNLHAAAKFIHQHLRGKFPEDYEGIRNLKGVGDYTAAAIASFAFNLPYPVVDANVFRILSRWFGIETAIDSTAGKQQFRALAEQLLPKQHAARFNQAMMDFGAVQCLPKNPDCARCVLAEGCFARKHDLVHLLPVKAKKATQRERFFHYVVIRDGAHTYLRRRGQKDIWQNMFEFPMVEVNRSLSGKELLRSKEFKSVLGTLKVKKLEFSKALQQKLTHQKINAAFYVATLAGKPENGDLLKITSSKIGEYAVPGIIRDYVEAHGFTKLSS